VLVNFYKHHIGDYAQATAHLSFVEDAAYSRMLRKYYADERPLPSDVKAVQRLVGARSREEKEAVQTVLDEFFELKDDGWHNRRADSEVAKANAQADTNRRIAEEREARKRGRMADGSLHESFNDPAHDSLSFREPSQTPDTRLQTPDSTSYPIERVVGDSPSPCGDGPPLLLPIDPATPAIPPCDHAGVLALWREHMPANPQPEKWTAARARHLQTRWRELFAEGKVHDRTEALAWFARFFRYLAKSRFLTGRVTPREPGRPTFVAELPWVLQPENFVRCIEGKYHQEA
jgi:uncharacterized protein YdaU (DUF1376 family)